MRDTRCVAPLLLEWYQDADDQLCTLSRPFAMRSLCSPPTPRHIGARPSTASSQCPPAGAGRSASHDLQASVQFPCCRHFCLCMHAHITCMHVRMKIRCMNMSVMLEQDELLRLSRMGCSVHERLLHACSGQGYSLTNNFISNGRGNGAIVRGANGNIQNNNISYVALNSFNFAPGFDGTHEGGFAQSMTVPCRAPPLTLPMSYTNAVCCACCWTVSCSVRQPARQG